MKTDNPLDKKLELWASRGRTPAKVHDAVVFASDTLELSWAAAQAIFEDRATPEAALAIYDRVRARIEEAPQEKGATS